MRPTYCGLSSDLGFAWWLRLRVCVEAPQGLRNIHSRMSYIETCGHVKQLRQSLSCGVRYVACHVQVALLLLSFLGPRWCQWCSDWCALGCSATVAFGCVCSSHVSGWLTSVEVFAAVPPGVSCRVGSGDTLWPVRTLGRRQVDAVGNRYFLVFSKQARAPVSRRYGR